ncbi:15972_t:CDS:2, partial [Funneliformis mosseae]
MTQWDGTENLMEPSILLEYIVNLQIFNFRVVSWIAKKIRNINSETKTIKGRTFAELVISKIPQKKDEYDKSDEIDDFFNNSTSISEEDDNSFTSEDYGDPDYIQSDIKGQNPQPLLISSQLENFLKSYKKMNVAHKWVLSSE